MIALLNDPIRDEDSIKIMVDKKGEVIHIPTFKKRNPYTLQFDIPGLFSPYFISFKFNQNIN